MSNIKGKNPILQIKDSKNTFIINICQTLNFKVMSFISEFKEFAMKGNVLDMAVGVIIGGAFGKIVSSLVDDILMPVVGMITGNIDFTTLAFKIGEGEEAAVLKYGNFIQNTVDFLIVAFCIFLMLKAINKMNRKKEEPAAPAEPAGPTQEELLAEIRDLLKNK